MIFNALTVAQTASGGNEGDARVSMLIAVLFILVISSLYGFEIIQKVPATLHTPLMSGSNAISGITVVGALICLVNLEEGSLLAAVIGVLALAFAMINVVGGFLVTDRMLQMFTHKRR